MLNKFILVTVILQFAWTEQVIEKTGAVSKECTEGQSGDAGKCASGKCVTIGADKICSQCAKTADEAPLNGVCQVPSDANICKTKAGGKCTECAGQSFMYQGGCYEQSDAFGQTICTALDAGTAGVCKTCAAGYFKNPANLATSDSCIACGDTTGVTIGADGTAKTYKGVANCAKCDPPGQITGGSGGTKEATCTACGDGFFVKDGSTKTCEACGDENCATCAEAGTEKCTACKADGKMYLKKNTGSDKGTCVAVDECGDGTYADTSSKECKGCDSTCKTCSGGATNDKCTSCKTDTPYLKKADGSQTGTCVNKAGCPSTHYIDEAAKTCSACASAGTTDCTTCEKGTDGAVVCKTCTTGEKTIFGLNKRSCVKECPADSTKQNDTCVCNGGFTPSTDSSACVAASTGTNLSTGAIAGISVAAVVVVGGLVGFLCWWFVCRGKA